MKKTYVLDTSVLMHDCESFLAFEDNNVIIPVTVLDELDNLKSKDGDKGFKARKAIKRLAEFLDNGSNSSIEFCKNVEKNIDNDYKIIGCAKNVGGILVTRDINCRVKAFSVGVESQYYKKDTVNVQDECIIELPLDFEYIDELYTKGYINIEGTDLYENQPVIVSNGSSSCLTVFNNNKLKHIKPPKNVCGIKPQDVKQKFAFHFIKSDIPLCIFEGSAGTGKTIISLAAALDGYMLSTYRKIIVTKPIIPVGGNTIGFLPGPQPLDSKVLTPDGWVRMGDVDIGDYVIGKDGDPKKVLDIFSKGEKPVYRIDTEIGNTYACGDHIWATKTERERTHNKMYSLKNTMQIKQTLLDQKGDGYNHNLPCCDAVNFNEYSKLYIPPYLLGVMLGIGNFKDCCFICTDGDILFNIEECIKDKNIFIEKENDGLYKIISEVIDTKCKRVRITSEEGYYNVYESVKSYARISGSKESTIRARCRNNSTVDGITFEYDTELNGVNYMQWALFGLSLYNIDNTVKHIPYDYKLASIEDRFSLIRGILDSSGDIISDDKVIFKTPSEDLLKGTQEVCLSLGIKAVINDGALIIDAVPGIFSTSYKSKIVDDLPIKTFYNKVTNIEYKGYEEVKCLLIASDDHLYVTDDYIITHNTVDEKMDPWLGCIYDNLDFLKYGNDIDSVFVEDIIEPVSIEFIRGRSLRNCFVIIEEAQNIAPDVLKTILTRIGEGTKIVVCGDLSQIDTTYLDKNSSGLTKLIGKTTDSDLVAFMKLTKCVRSKVASLIDDIM